MQLSWLSAHPPYSDKLAESGVLIREDNSLRLPSIPKLQQLIERAWRDGFDRAGADQLGARLTNTRKWIGATEIAALLRHSGLKADVTDFHTPTGPSNTHPRLFQWMFDYFNENASAAPLYFQHQGHSRTVVGIETLSADKKRLLIFDHSHTKANMPSANRAKVLNSLRKSIGDLKHKQYQIVSVSGLLTEAEREAAKVIHPYRVP